MKNTKTKSGFTLMELLVTMAIIGILSGVVMVSLQGGVEKSKTASAITTLSSILPELVTCADDGGGINAYNTASNICTASGHNVKWPDISKSGYTINATTAPAATNANISTYEYAATRTDQPTITCIYADNECTKS